MKKTIIAIAALTALTAMAARKYPIQMDGETKVILLKDEIMEANGIASATLLAATTNRFQFSTVSSNSTLEIVAVEEGVLKNTGIPLANFQWMAGVTNLSQVAAFIATGDQPNGYPILDINGKIKNEAIPTITIVYTGGEITE